MRATTLVALTLVALAGSACSTNQTAVQDPNPAPTVTPPQGTRAGYPQGRGSVSKMFGFEHPADPASMVGGANGAEFFDPRTHVVAQSSVDGSIGDAPEGLTQVTFANEGADFDPAVSRDGKMVVFASTQHRPTADLYIARVGSRAITQLTADAGNDVMPALSPDNTLVAFASDRSGSWQIYVMPSNGGRAVQITDGQNNSGDALHPTWSPDGSHMAFCRLGSMSRRWELWVVAVANPSSAEFIGYGLFPDWCPVAGTGMDGSHRIVFQRGRERADRAFGIWSIDYKPGSVGNPVELVSNVGAAAINPSWSTDGQFIAYSMTPTDYQPQQNPSALAPSDVWVVSADGAARVNVTSGNSSNLSPTWGNDGKLYFVSDRGGREQLWSISSAKALAAMPMPNMRTAFAPTPAITRPLPAQVMPADRQVAQKAEAPSANPAPQPPPAEEIQVTEPMATVPTP